MKAVLCKELGPAEKLVVEQVPSPKPAKGQVVVMPPSTGSTTPVR